MEGAGVAWLVNLDPVDLGIVAGSVEPDRQTTGMMLSHQGAAHALLETTPFTLGVAHTACTQLFPYLRMTVADRDLAPLCRHLELLAERDRIDRDKYRGDQEGSPAEDTQ